MHLIFLCELYISNSMDPVILLSAHPASFVHNFVSVMQSFLFQRVPGCNSIADLSLKNSVLDL